MAFSGASSGGGVGFCPATGFGAGRKRSGSNATAAASKARRKVGVSGAWLRVKTKGQTPSGSWNGPAGPAIMLIKDKRWRGFRKGPLSGLCLRMIRDAVRGGIWHWPSGRGSGECRLCPAYQPAPPLVVVQGKGPAPEGGITTGASPATGASPSIGGNPAATDIDGSECRLGSGRVTASSWVSSS